MVKTYPLPPTTATSTSRAGAQKARTDASASISVADSSVIAGELTRVERTD